MKRLSILIFSFFNFFVLLFCGSCTEDIDESNLYTFTGETIEDFLLNRSDRYSSFNYILQRIGYDKILAAYGQYTCFAPDNDAVAAYIDSLYDDTTNKDFEHNGMTQRGLDGLTDSLCKDIALFHLLTTKVMGVNMGNGMTIKTILGRDINTSLDSITASVAINREAKIDSMDVELENGVLHTITHVITRSNRLVAGELEANSDYTIFTQALKLTGLADSLIEQKRSVTRPANADRLKFYVPESIDLGYTIFAETDDVFRANGIDSLPQLIDYANAAYGRCAVAKNSQTQEGWYDYYRNQGIEVSTGTDYQSPYNALNMFVRYHILRYKVPYTKLVYSYNEQTAKVTLFEYYETMLPCTLFKVTRNSGRRLINRWVQNNTLTDRVAEQGTLLMHQVPAGHEGIEIQNRQTEAFNGYVHPISGMLVYDWYVPNYVLNERMRFDVASLFGEMMSNSYRLINDDVVTGLNGGVTGTDGNLGGGYIRIVGGMFDHMRIYDEESTRLYYLPGQKNSWSNFQGDEYNCKGIYDFALRLPPVPDNTYELRLGYTANGNRGMLQFYLGSSSEKTSMQALDIPLDMRHTPSSSDPENPDVVTGWCLYTATSDNGVESDANMRNLGYMRGPLYYCVGPGGTVARANSQDLRRILARQNFQQGEYWLRFKSVIDDDASQFHLDYIEFCPENVYNNTRYVEDMY